MYYFKKLVLLALFLMVSAGTNLHLRGQEQLPDTVWTKIFNDISGISCVKFSPTGNIIAVGTEGFNWDNGVIFLVNSENGNIISELKGHSINIETLDFSSTGDTLLSAGREIILWKVKTGEKLKTFTNVYKVARFMKNDSKILSISSNQKDLVIIDRNTGVIEKSKNFSEVPIFEYSKINDKISIKQYLYFDEERNSWVSQIELWDANTFEKIATLGRHNDEILDMAFSPDGTMLASAGKDGYAKIWDINNYNLLDSISNNYSLYFISALFSNDSKYLILGDGGTLSNQLQVFDLINKLNFRYNINFEGFGSAMFTDISFNNTIITSWVNKIMLLNPKWNTVNVNTTEYKNPILYPNPTSNSINIEFTLLITEYVKIELSDLSGNTLSEIFSGYLASGKNTVPYNCNNLTQGIYFIKVTSPSFKATYKLIKEG